MLVGLYIKYEGRRVINAGGVSSFLMWSQIKYIDRGPYAPIPFEHLASGCLKNLCRKIDHHKDYQVVSLIELKDKTEHQGM